MYKKIICMISSIHVRYDKINGIASLFTTCDSTKTSPIKLKYVAVHKFYFKMLLIDFNAEAIILI